MRAILIVGIVIVAVWLVDQGFYSGTYSRAVGQMLQRVGHSFR
jgi:hypothetical protein